MLERKGKGGIVCSSDNVQLKRLSPTHERILEDPCMKGSLNGSSRILISGILLTVSGERTLCVSLNFEKKIN